MKKRICIMIVLLMIVSIIALGVYMRQRAFDDAYHDAIALMSRGSYEGAISEFEKANSDMIDRDNFLRNVDLQRIRMPYKNTIPLYAYALAQIEYNNDGDLTVVNNYLEVIPEDYQGELNQEINVFKNNFKPQYEEFLVEQERIVAKKKAEESKREVEKIRNGVPYVGMKEYFIDKTSLGAPSPTIRHNSQMISGKVYQANLYDFKEGSKTIFTARCVQGKVTEVWDERNTPENIYRPSTSHRNDATEDPYNAKDYYDAEDFYDDYEDEFYDYEEAEEYYNEHGMW